MKKIFLALPFLLIFLLQSCQKDTLVSPKQSIQQPGHAEYYVLNLDEASTRNLSSWTVLADGSVNALAAAIDSSLDNGVIYLKAGMHTETHPIVITKPVKIIGEAGAILKIPSDIAPLDSTGAAQLHPGIHILNAPGTLIQDLQILPISDDGGTAILVEKSSGSAVMRCHINSFQYGVMIEKSDRMTIMGNTMVASGIWLSQTGFEAHCIVNINGTSPYISDNDLSNALFGIWACDRWGTVERNNTHDNYIGIILCNVPHQAYILPSGEITGSQYPATAWKARNNKSANNFNVGYLVIDGASYNTLEDNNAYGNGSYDMELTTDTYRFGFLTPASYKNTVNAGIYPNITIKDCGNGNSVTGGVWIDTTIDPCN